MTLLLILLAQSALAVAANSIPTTSPKPAPTIADPNNNNNNNKLCSLGNETYHLGELWNPNLPPFGVQVCVLCECSVRQRKSCYEPRVVCRRIISECPIIDSCPDGSKPVTNAGQCCKSCQQTANKQTQPSPPGAPTDGTGGAGNLSATPTMHYQRQERIKEYQTIMKNFEPCPRIKQDSSEKQTVSILNASSSQKSSKLDGGSSKNDINGIDSRLAFKSLHDSQSNHLSQITHKSSSSSSSGSHSRNELPSPSRDTSTPLPASTPQATAGDYQQPNDIQSGSQSTNNNQQINNNQQQQQHHQLSINSNRFFSSNTNIKNTPTTKQANCNTCSLGNETFEVGDRWNPDLPPFGIQYCVQCNCLAMKPKGKGCYETKVQCRRTYNDCPIIDICPDGRKPITIPGQCCKTCQSSLTTKTRK